MLAGVAPVEGVGVGGQGGGRWLGGMPCDGLAPPHPPTPYWSCVMACRSWLVRDVWLTEWAALPVGHLVGWEPWLVGGHLHFCIVSWCGPTLEPHKKATP